MTDIRQQLLAAFEAEHKEHIEAIRVGLSQMRAGAGADLRDVFRHAHSLKGASRAVDLPELEELAHQLESVFLGLANEMLTLGDDAFDAIQAVLDLIEAYVAASNRGAPLPSLSAATGTLQEIGRGETLRPSPAPAPRVQPPPKPTDTHYAALEHLRVPARQIDVLAAGTHELMREVGNQAAQSVALGHAHADQREILRQWELLRREIGRETSPTDAVAGLLAVFEEQLRAFARGLTSLVQSKVQADWSIAEAVKHLREQVDQISLIPAEAVFGDMARMTRDLARAQNRAVEVTVTGLEVQADRSVLQRLRDPVIHSLRNAVSHGGTESVDERLAKSKPAALQVALAISSHSGELIITIRDDGPGPDLALIEARAVRSGLLQPSSIGPRRAPLLDLVFQAGFSTVDSADAISGRGIGLSAVAEEARKLRGRVWFGAASPGAELRIMVPLAASRQSLLFVAQADQTYGIPSHGVEQLLQLSLGDFVGLESEPAVRTEMGGQSVVVPFVPLSRLLNMPPSEPSPLDGPVKAVMLRRGTQRLAVQVDAFLDVQPGVIGSAEALADASPLVGGTAFMGSSMPVVILDHEALLDGARHPVAKAAPRAAKVAARPARTVLVVDDSITTRTLEKSILEAQGYQVMTSVDGLDALAALRSGHGIVDLVIADVEMPRLDGFGLLQAMKADPKLAAIPVIVVTSREDPTHVRRGLELGAAAYMTKQKFDQRELLTTIGQVL